MRGYSFNMSHRLVYSVLRINLYQQMNVIRHDFHFNYLRINSDCCFYNQLL